MNYDRSPDSLFGDQKVFCLVNLPIIRKSGKIDGVESSPEYCIEENCTFDAMIKDNIETIRDELYKKLKAQGVLR